MSSLFSILSSITNGTSASSTSNAQVSTVEATLNAAKASAKTTATGSVATSTTISDAARLAAAAKADNAKDFSGLALEVRQGLDAQYGKGANTATANLDELSGRALATMALNQDGQFSRAEQAVAKMELKQREQAVLTDALSSGLSIASLANYGKALATQYDAMSAEERTALGYTDRIRLNAAQMAAKTSPVGLFNQS